MKNKKLIICVVALCAVVGILLGVYFGTRSKPVEGQKDFTVVVVHADGSEKTFNYSSSEEYLGTVLTQKGLVQGETTEYGLYIQVVDGEEAVYENDGAYWAFYVGDTYASTGVDQTPIENGATYKLAYTVG